MAERKYTWAIVTYASREEFTPLLDRANHWAFCYHDKDWKVDDEGKRVPKEPHTHILATFKENLSFESVRRLIDSEQNTLAQKARNEEGSIYALYRYLIHADESPLEKNIYDDSDRIVDDKSYWLKRCNERVLGASHETFFEDLLSDDFSIRDMGRKYGRDFIKNLSSYMDYRRRVLIQDQYDACEGLRGLLERCVEMNIPVDEVYSAIYEVYADRVTELSYNSNCHRRKKQ